jgi:hypothetical protein
MDPAGSRAAAHGLAGMRFRVQSSRGQLKIKSRMGQGTTIQARLPLPDHVQDAIDTVSDVSTLLGPGSYMPAGTGLEQAARQRG